MSLKISQWKSRIGQDNDYHKPWSYEVAITVPSSRSIGSRFEMVKLRTENVSMPGASFLSVDNYRPFGGGSVYNIPYGYNPQEITMTHVLDGSANLYEAFWYWMVTIVDSDGANRYGAYYFDNYKAQMQIHLKNPNRPNRTEKIVYVKDVYPSALDQTQLSWAETDQTTKINVTYRYLHWTMDRNFK